MTVKVCPAIAIVLERGPPPILAWTVNRTVPFPLPDAPEVTTIHGAWLTAVHVQPAPAMTFTEPEPPFCGIDTDGALNANVHPDD